MRSLCASRNGKVLSFALMILSAAVIVANAAAASGEEKAGEGTGMPVMNDVSASLIYTAAFTVLLIAYLTAISSRDLIRLLISLEMMFGAVFLSLIPMFSLSSGYAAASVPFAIAILTVFVSSGELLILIAAIVMFDSRKKSTDADLVREGGDRGV